nr:polymer-forming cytoskeletal protein [Bacteroidota bacterium]
MAKSNGLESSPSINFLGTGTSIKGNITSNGDFRIDGTLNGSINSKGKVVIGASGIVDGEIICQNADISGKITAKVVVHELLTLKSSANLSGDIFTKKLAIEPGAKFSGTCNMGDIPNREVIVNNDNEGLRKKEKAII